MPPTNGFRQGALGNLPAHATRVRPHRVESRLFARRAFTRQRHSVAPRKINDAYLLALASGRRGVLATFDRGLRELAGQRSASALEVVPTR